MATSIRLDDETEKRLERLSTETGRTKAFYLRELIERGLLKPRESPGSCGSV